MYGSQKWRKFAEIARFRALRDIPSITHYFFLVFAGYGCGRQAASTYKQYACFAFLRSLVLAAPKYPIYL
jgi:hypothetical protein